MFKKGKIIKIRLGINPNSSGHGLLFAPIILLPTIILFFVFRWRGKINLGRALEKYKQTSMDISQDNNLRQHLKRINDKFFLKLTSIMLITNVLFFYISDIISRLILRESIINGSTFMTSLSERIILQILLIILPVIFYFFIRRIRNTTIIRYMFEFIFKDYFRFFIILLSLFIAIFLIFISVIQVAILYSAYLLIISLMYFLLFYVFAIGFAIFDYTFLRFKFAKFISWFLFILYVIGFSCCFLITTVFLQSMGNFELNLESFVIALIISYILLIISLRKISRAQNNN